MEWFSWQQVKLALAGIGGFFVWMWAWWQRRRQKALEETVARQQEALEMYAKKEEIRRRDEQMDRETENQLGRVAENVAKAEGKKEQAEVVADALDGFFSSASPSLRSDGVDREEG